MICSILEIFQWFSTICFAERFSSVNLSKILLNGFGGEMIHLSVTVRIARSTALWPLNNPQLKLIFARYALFHSTPFDALVRIANRWWALIVYQQQGGNAERTRSGTYKKWSYFVYKDEMDCLVDCSQTTLAISFLITSNLEYLNAVSTLAKPSSLRKWTWFMNNP